jgi:4-carboxymuconolactone decarboxylase
MKVLTLAAALILLFPASQAQTATTQAGTSPTASSPGSLSIQITRGGTQHANKGPAEYFTGSLMVEELFPSHDPSRASGGKVTFEPGARSAWHTHPLGQILIVTDGTGWIQQWGGPIEEIKTGDVIWIPAGVKHWHGATSDTAMTHLAIQEQIDGKAVNWMEKVTEEQYRSGRRSKPMQTVNESRVVAPALEKYARGPIAELWKRPELSPRDRSIVTIAALIARNQTIEMSYYFNLALDNGVKPREISEIITHLAFYSGWANAMSAAAIAKDVFAGRQIGADQLPAALPSLLPLNKEVEAKRATNVQQQFGDVAPGIVQYTTDVLFRDLWLRPDLTPRDRSLVTVSALIASGQVAQITYHLNRAMDNGLTQEQAGEVVTHLAFYAGWPNAFSALPVVKDVFEKRSQQR